MNLDKLGDFAKDVKLNVPTLLSVEGAPGFTQEQIDFVALALAYSTKDVVTIHDMTEYANDKLTPELIEAAKAAATIMAMNNVYYRSTHLLEDADIERMPARLRMNIILKSGAPKAHFELASLAISALNGCGKCLKAHKESILKEGLSKESIHSAIRIAGVVASLAQANSIQSIVDNI